MQYWLHRSKSVDNIFGEKIENKRTLKIKQLKQDYPKYNGFKKREDIKESKW